MATLKRAIVLAALASALVVFGAACDDDDGAESQNNAQQSEVDALSIRVQRNEMMHAIVQLGKLDLHAMDETLNDTGEVEFAFVPNTRMAIRLLALTDWSSAFKDDADSVRVHAEALLTALESEDIPTAADAAHELHDTAHDFDRAVWNDLAKDLPPDAGGPQEEEEEAEEAPAAATTGTPPTDDHGDDETPPAGGAP